MFTLTIETDNAAFEDAGIELARILQRVAEHLTTFGARGVLGDGLGTIRDTNGNAVGGWKYRA